MGKKLEKALLAVCTGLMEGQRTVVNELTATRRQVSILTNRVKAMEAKLSARTPAEPELFDAPSPERDRARYLIGRLARRKNITRSEAYHMVYDVFAAAQGYDPLEEATKLDPKMTGIGIIAQRGHLPQLIETVVACNRNN